MSKFQNILDAANQPQEQKVVKKKTKAIKKPSPPTTNEKSKPIKKGRPKGKRSNPDFEQVTAYVRSETYRKTKIALLQQSELEDFSGLVEELLTEWLSTRKGKKSRI